MRSKLMIMLFAVCAFALLSSSSFANVFASDVSVDVSAIDRGVGETATISYVLNDDADQVLIHFFPAGDPNNVQHTIAGTTNRGLNTVVFDGGLNKIAEGTYGFKVEASQNPGYADWTNISPVETYATDVWTTSTFEYAISNNGNQGRGIAYLGSGKIVLTETNQAEMFQVLVNGEVDEPLGCLALDSYDLDNDGDTGTTWTLCDYLGPYDLACTSGGDVFVCRFESAPGGPGTPQNQICKLDTAGGFHTPVAQQTGSYRAMDAVDNGTDVILYGSATTSVWDGAAEANVFTYATDARTTYTVLENITGSSMSHAIIAKESNTGGDGDVVWLCSNVAGSQQRYVRSGGAWAADPGFVFSVDSSNDSWCGGDYVQVAGQDYIIVIVNGDPQKIYLVNGDTGAVVASWDPASLGLARLHSGGNGDIDAFASSTTGYIYAYFSMPDWDLVGEVFFGVDVPVRSTYYDDPSGIVSIRDQTDAQFGHIFIANGDEDAWPYGAESGEGLYQLNADLSWVGGSADASFASVPNPEVSPWDPNDNWSPFKMGLGADDGVLYVGSYGTLDESKFVYRYDRATTGTKLIPETLIPYQWLRSGQSVGTGASTVLYMLGHSATGSSFGSVYAFPVGTTTENYTGVVDQLSTGPSHIGRGDMYTPYHIEVASDGRLYMTNSRWSATQTAFGCGSTTDTGVNYWYKSVGDFLDYEPAMGTDIGYVRDAAIYEEVGKVACMANYVYRADYQGRTWFFLFDMYDGTILDAVPVSAPGEYHYYFYGIEFDPAENMILGNRGYNWVEMWSPPGANAYTTVALPTVTITATRVDDWMVF